MNNIKAILCELNPDFERLYPYLEKRMRGLRENKANKAKESDRFHQNQTVLITYADQFSQDSLSNLEALDKFITDDLEGCISHVHILPFYPWTSDDGFAPINYHEVCQDYGTWDHIENLSAQKMFDCVFNHVSSENDFFKKALKGDQQCQQMFHLYHQDEYEDNQFQKKIPLVVRPRTSPLFTPFNSDDGLMYAWTTFGPDQIDTNLNNVDMLKYILESLFLYIEKGATFFRVDAVPFMWKELGTSCSHLEKTHLFVKLLRAITDQIDPSLLIITESNVPHQENITYWGNGLDEAHVIYNFSLAPLILHALHFQTSQYLNDWAKKVFTRSPETTYLNFTATHDGIGLRGLEGIVSESDVESLCERAKNRGGVISKKMSRDGTEKPYEMNITWASILSDEHLSEDTYLNKIVNSHALVMFLPGIGAHYVHNFFATKNWDEGFQQSGIARRLNRQKLSYPVAYTDFSKKVKERLISFIRFKNSEECFAPQSSLEILSKNDNVFTFRRFTSKRSALIHFNLSHSEQEVDGVTLAAFELSITVDK